MNYKSFIKQLRTKRFCFLIKKSIDYMGMSLKNKTID